MKTVLNFKLGVILLALVASTFVSCEKEPPIPNPEDQIVTAPFLTFGVSNTDCKTSAPSFCQTSLLTAKETLDFYPLNLDEATGTATVDDNGAINMDLRMNLASPDVLDLLLVRRLFIFAEESVLDREVVRQAYENSGKVWDGKDVVLPPGELIVVDDPGDVDTQGIIIIHIHIVGDGYEADIYIVYCC